MTLTKEEIEMIEREAEKLFSDACEPVLLSEYLYGDVQKIVIGMLRRTATKYLPQLKAERERAGKLAETMLEIATYCPSAETCVIAKEAYEKYNNKNTITNHEKTNNSSMPDDCAGGGGAVPDIPNPST